MNTAPQARSLHLASEMLAMASGKSAEMEYCLHRHVIPLLAFTQN